MSIGNVLAAAGMALGLKNSNDNRKAQSKASDAAYAKIEQQQPLIDRAIGIMDKLSGLVSSAEHSGLFDPEARIDAKAQAREEFYGDLRNNSTTLDRIAGFRPGDTASERRIAAVDAAELDQKQQDELDAQRGAFMDNMAAWQGTNPELALAGASTLGQSARDGLAYSASIPQQNPAGLISGVMPFLDMGGGGGGKSLPSLDQLDRVHGFVKSLPAWAGGF